MPEVFSQLKVMRVTNKHSNRKRCKSIVYIFTILFFGILLIYHFPVYAEGEVIIDPESISGDNDKEGNVLAESGFVVFTEESMSYMQAIKEREKAELDRTVDELFEREWDEIENYDKKVKETIDAGNLFSTVNTGVEIIDEQYENSFSFEKFHILLVVLIMTVMSASVISWRRIRNEHKRNNRAG